MTNVLQGNEQTFAQFFTFALVETLHYIIVLKLESVQRIGARNHIPLNTFTPVPWLFGNLPHKVLRVIIYINLEGI